MSCPDLKLNLPPEECQHNLNPIKKDIAVGLFPVIVIDGAKEFVSGFKVLLDVVWICTENGNSASLSMPKSEQDEFVEILRGLKIFEYK